MDWSDSADVYVKSSYNLGQYQWLVFKASLNSSKNKVSATAFEKHYHCGDHRLVVLHECLLVLLGPLKQSIHHCSAEVCFHLLLQFWQNHLLCLCRAFIRHKDNVITSSKKHSHHHSQWTKVLCNSRLLEIHHVYTLKKTEELLLIEKDTATDND